MNPEIDTYIDKLSKWQDELDKLREIMLSCQLKEEFKWASPCYSYLGNNIIGMRGFKEHCALWFFKGALLNDPYNILIKPGEDTQAMRQMRFTSLPEILYVEQKLREYIF